MWIYIALCASLALNVGLGIALVITSRKHKSAAQQLHYYNICNGR
jgi:hypothetical protein